MPSRARGRSRRAANAEFLAPDELAAWRGLLVATNRVLRQLDAELRAAHGISVGEFDVLITLYNAPERQRLRMTELAQQVSLTPAGLTHMVTRLERERLVTREVNPSDRRGFYTVLTPAGLERLNAARPTHNAVIRRLFSDRITVAERRELGRVWEKVLSTP